MSEREIFRFKPEVPVDFTREDLVFRVVKEALA